MPMIVSGQGSNISRAQQNATLNAQVNLQASTSAALKKKVSIIMPKIHDQIDPKQVLFLLNNKPT